MCVSGHGMLACSEPFNLGSWIKHHIYKPCGEIQFFRTFLFSVVELLLVCIHLRGESSFATLLWMHFLLGKNTSVLILSQGLEAPEKLFLSAEWRKPGTMHFLISFFLTNKQNHKKPQQTPACLKFKNTFWTLSRKSKTTKCSSVLMLAGIQDEMPAESRDI